MPVTIRSADLADIPAILEIERQAASAAHWTREQYAELLRLGTVLVAEHEGAVVGMIATKEVAGEREIENLVVAESARRQGIGRALLDELLSKARAMASAVVWLEVRESNLVARRFYEKNGFREAGRRARYYREPVEDALLYRLQVSGAKL